MAGRNSSKRNQRSRNAKARRRRQVLGAGTTAGAFLAFGMTPLATAPPAHADVDAILDPVINSILSSVTSLDGLLGIDPSAGFDLALPATDVAAADLGSLALPATDALPGAASSADALTAAASSADAAPAADPSLTTLFETYFFDPLQTDTQAWITSPDGIAFDTQLNTVWQEFGGQGILIGNGANGIADGTLTQADGGAGGLLFGDGGNGATDAAGQGGTGGEAYLGVAGNGGNGADDGGAGGAGGNVPIGWGGHGGTWGPAAPPAPVGGGG